MPETTTLDNLTQNYTLLHRRLLCDCRDQRRIQQLQKALLVLLCFFSACSRISLFLPRFAFSNSPLSSPRILSGPDTSQDSTSIHTFSILHRWWQQSQLCSSRQRLLWHSNARHQDLQNVLNPRTSKLIATVAFDSGWTRTQQKLPAEDLWMSLALSSPIDMARAVMDVKSVMAGRASED